MTAPDLTAATTRETILLVEDQREMRERLCSTLRGQGYRVLAARSDREAVDVAQIYGAPIHLVVTDGATPEEKGRELVNVVRRWYPAVGTLFTPKPFRADELIERIHLLLGGQLGLASAVTQL